MIQLQAKYLKYMINQQDQLIDSIAMQHDVNYAVCKDDRKCKNKADRKMVQTLDNVPYNKRQWGHWLARNVIHKARTRTWS